MNGRFTPHIATALLTLTLCLNTASAEPTTRTPAPADAKLYFISPAHGETVTNPVKVRFGLQGMGVAPAGVDRDATGHHHLLINVDELPPLDKPLPADERHRHFGGGQTEVLLELPPGRHTLRLILGDENHIPHDPPVISEPITIEVVPAR